MGNTTVVTYSPTGTTRRICDAVARGLNKGLTRSVDLTRADGHDGTSILIGGGVAVIGVPVYTGRVAEPAMQRLQLVRADNVPAVLVVVYGNRTYGDALVELRDLALAAGFKPLAAAAFIGEHSYSTLANPLAQGRPDPVDLELARELGVSAARNLDCDAGVPDIPGQTPYCDRVSMPALTPTLHAECCTDCGQCITACPTAAISADGAKTDVDRCTLCCACVKVCPAGARELTGPWIAKVSTMLREACAHRREPVLYV